MNAAIIAFAVCLPLTALIWQAGRVTNLRVLLAYKREKQKTEWASESKRWEEAMAIGNESTRSLKADFEKLQSEFNVIKARLESGRTELKRTA